MKSIQDEMNEERLLVLIECEDGMFRQVLLNSKQFKKVSDSIFSGEPLKEGMRAGFEAVEITINDEWEMEGDKFIGLSSRTH